MWVEAAQWIAADCSGPVMGSERRRIRDTDCWTYSLHCQIANEIPSKRWIGEFWGFRICMCGMDLHNGILRCGFLCARIISLYFSTLLLPLPCVFSVSLLRLPRQGLPRPIYIARAITPSPLHGYHACVFTSRLSRHSTEFHFRVITPELSRFTTHVPGKSGYHTRLS